MTEKQWAVVASVKCAKFAGDSAQENFGIALRAAAVVALQGACGAKNAEYLADPSGQSCE